MCCGALRKEWAKALGDSERLVSEGEMRVVGKVLSVVFDGARRILAVRAKLGEEERKRMGQMLRQTVITDFFGAGAGKKRKREEKGEKGGGRAEGGIEVKGRDKEQPAKKPREAEREAEGRLRGFLVGKRMYWEFKAG